jgi:hypothetical protein
MQRGSYGFEVQFFGNLIDSVETLERARVLFRDGVIISQRWGPGNQGDFDNGGWHSLCHLAAASGVFKSGSGFLWAGITHAGTTDRYLATLSFRETSGNLKTIEMGSAEGRDLLGRAVLVGYVEGTSEGHVSARTVRDSPGRFNGWRRQEFDRPAEGDKSEGGTVWEHWCATRDLRSSDSVGDSVLRAYMTLVSVLGGEFVAAVIRGRRKYNHPEQLCALVKAGFVARDEALRDMKPREIPPAEECLFKEARPADSLRAVEKLAWPNPPERYYYMFKRAIKSFSKRTSVESDLRSFGI